MRVETMSLGTPVQTSGSLLTAPAARIAWRWWMLWLACFGAFSMMAPRDASFDVAHYQLHNGWSVLNNRRGQDLAPAELHSFLNPAWQVFVWLLVDNLPGRLVAFILGVLQGLGLPALYTLTRRLLERSGATPAQLTALVISLGGFAAEAQFGLLASVRNDAVCAAAFLGTLVLLLPDDQGVPGLKRLGFASLLMGALVGLKLTNSVYVVFFAISVLVLLPTWKGRTAGAVVCALAGLAGILVTGGPWALEMYNDFNNPIFPLMNSLFDAPLGPDVPFRDARYVPGGIFDVALHPFIFLFDGKLVNEYDFLDPRLQLGYLASIGLLMLATWRAFGKGVAAARSSVAFAAAFIGMIIIWGLMFSIARYVSAAWMLGPVLVAVLIATWRAGLVADRLAPHISVASVAVLFLLTQPSDLRRVAWTTWSGAYVEAELPAEMDFSNATIAFSGGYPSAFLASFFPETARFTHLVPQEWSTPALANYRYQIRDMIQATGQDFYVVIVYTSDHVGETVRRLAEIENITVDLPNCAWIKTSLDSSAVRWKVCPADTGLTPAAR